MYKITVLQITRGCGLSTRCFYNHFRDKHDLMNYIYHSINEPCWYEQGRLLPLTKALKNWIVVGSGHSEIWANAYKYVGQNSIRDYVLAKTVSDLRRLVAFSKRPELLNDQRASALIKYHAFALSSMMEYKYTGPSSEKTNVHVDTVMDAMPDYLREIFVAEPQHLVPRGFTPVSQIEKNWPVQLF